MKVSENYYDEIFDFSGQWELPSKCGLRVLEKGGKKIIIVTELYQDNPGTSVTYAGASLLQQICEKKGFLSEEVIYLECNPDTNSKLSFYNEEYFEVRFDEKYKKPQYRKLSPGEKKSLIG
jgi:hypothetical protein